MSLFEGIELPEDVRTQLEAKIAETYVAKTEFDAVNAKREELLREVKKVKETKTEAELAAEAAKLEAHIKAGDVESLRKSYEEKLTEKQKQIEEYTNKQKQSKIKEIASTFTNEHIIDDPFVREAFIKEFASRLDVRGEESVVLDAQGNLTALSIDDLQKEFLQNSKYSNIIIGSKATGGSTTRSNNTTSSAKVKSLTEVDTKDVNSRYAVLAARMGQK